MFSAPLAMGGLPAGPFRAILADPPWRFQNWSAKGMGRSPDGADEAGAPNHYRTMSMLDLVALPVASVAADDCALFMWATWPMLPHAMGLMEAWGFAYKAGGAWATQSRSGRAWQFGLGYIFRSASEPLLVGVRGKPRWLSKSERNLWVAPVREHSRKPPCVHEAIERMTSGPRLELFAREAREGWESWGDHFDPPGAPTHRHNGPGLRSARDLSATGLEDIGDAQSDRQAQSGFWDPDGALTT